MLVAQGHRATGALRLALAACATVPLCLCAAVPLCLCALLIAGCASTGDPPGGAEDRTPPNVVSFAPESGAVLTEVPSEASINFDEVINERTAGTPTDMSGAVILSPVTEAVRVSWRRDRITVRPKSGFKPGRIYHLELLPVITDLRTNRMRGGRTIVFSTGPAIPEAKIGGTVVDWVGGRAAPRALVEAVLAPDSLVYRALADSGGVFLMEQLPPGHYTVYGVLDLNNDRRRGLREVFDSVGIDLDSTSRPLELFAFLHDTTGPRLRTVEQADSMTLKLTFDRPLDPTLVLDTSMVTVAPLEDTTAALAITGVFTQKGLDSAKARADSLSRAARDSARTAADSARAAADTTRPRPDSAAPRPDSARPRPDSARPRPDSLRVRPRPDSSRAPAARPAAPGARTAPGRPPLDSTRAERMIARRPPPTDVRFVRLAAPLAADTRYVIYVRGARSLSGNLNDGRSQLRTPRAPRTPARPPAAPAGPAPTVQPDSARRDSVR